MDTIHLQCPVTPVKSVKLQQDWIWVLLSLLISNTTCPDILWGNVCLRLFTLAVLKIWKGRGEKKKRSSCRKKSQKYFCVMFCLIFLSPVITGQHSEEAEDVRRIPEQGLHFGSVALWNLAVGFSAIHAGRMNFDLWWHDERSSAQTEGLTLCCFWRNESVKGPFCFSPSFLCTARVFAALKVEQHTLVLSVAAAE